MSSNSHVSIYRFLPISGSSINAEVGHGRVTPFETDAPLIFGGCMSARWARACAVARFINFIMHVQKVIGGKRKGVNADIVVFRY